MSIVYVKIILRTCLSKPKTIDDLLRNLKSLMERRALIRKDFYSKEFLNQTLGGDDVVFTAVSESEISGHIVNFLLLSSPTELEKVSPWISFSFKENGKIRANIEVSSITNDTRPKYKFILSLFGRNYELQPFTFHFPKGRPKLAPLGDQQIRYDAQNEEERQAIDVLFGEQENINMISFFDEIKNSENKK